MKPHKHKDVQDFIINYIKNSTLKENNVISGTTDFVESELLDSFAILGLIMSLESQFAVKFQTEEIADNNIQVIDSLADLVVSKFN